MLHSSPPQRPTLDPTTGLVPYDELRDDTGALRAHWNRYFEVLASVGPTEAKARWSQAKQLLQENGASYNVYNDTTGSEHPWRLSPIPLILDAKEWQEVASGIAQRARLLSCLLADIYGAQRTLMEGCLPSELVFDNPRFLRPIHGLVHRKHNWIPLYGVDLVRSPDGRFVVLEDATQAPAGMGYALENRIVVAQALPDLLRHCNVERLVGFFRMLRERLQNAAPHNRDAPRIALLTPGPHSATYFEQAYLAKYLGLSLVQGEDLTVRNDRVYLKTLGGLQPIDVLLRRVFDDFCDPLEFRPESDLGVPGLVQAIRSGNVNTMNPLGTGLLETPAIQAYLPRICRKLLSEDLRLAPVPTYYCGDPSHLAIVLDDFASMVIKPTHSLGHADSTFVHQLEPEQRAALKQRILAAPRAFVAQRFVPSSKAPVIVDGRIHSRAFVLRCFAHCDHPNDYQVMPGGLALVATSDADLAVSLQRGARSKDVWVVSDDSVLEGTVLPPVSPAIELSRGGGDLPSRVADNLFWLGRYTERAESVSRLSRVIGTRLLEFANERDLQKALELSPLLNALNLQIRSLYATDLPLERQLDPLICEREFLAAVLDPTCGGSAVSTLRSTLRVSRVVRDRVSHDTWRILAALDEAVIRLPSFDGPDRIPQLVNELNHVIITLAGFCGLAMESMTRGFAWRFLDMGRRLERAITTVTLLRATLVTPCERETSLIEAVLEVADSGMTYRRRYAASLQAAPTVDLLLADDSNPRSVIFQLKTLGEHIAALPPLTPVGVRSTQQRLVLSATSQIELSDIVELCCTNPATLQRDGVFRLLASLGTTLPALSDSLTETYLYHANVARHLRHEASASNDLTHLEATT